MTAFFSAQADSQRKIANIRSRLPAIASTGTGPPREIEDSQ
jgi:hypothetical protein